MLCYVMTAWQQHHKWPKQSTPKYKAYHQKSKNA